MQDKINTEEFDISKITQVDLMQVLYNTRGYMHFTHTYIAKR